MFVGDPDIKKVSSETLASAVEYREIRHLIGIHFHHRSALTFLGGLSGLRVPSDNLSSISIVYHYYFVFFPISSSSPVISAHFRASPHAAKSDSTILRVHS
jgi:hypothetical protein